MLHLISHDVLLSSEQIRLLNALAPNDAVLFLGSSVLEAPTILNNATDYTNQIHFYALSEDIQTFGCEDLPTYVKIIDYKQWVHLTMTHTPCQFW